jgi:hypothetical protein
MVAHPPVDASLLAMNRTGEWPENTLGAQVFAVFRCEVRARRQIVSAAKMPVAGSRQYCTADIAILPKIDPSLRDIVRGRLVQDIRLAGIVQRDVGDPIALLIVDGQIDLLLCVGVRTLKSSCTNRRIERLHRRQRAIETLELHQAELPGAALR